MTETSYLSLQNQTRSENSTMKDCKREWKFKVKAETTAGETVFVVGNCEQLGNWMSCKAEQLSKFDESENIWFAHVNLPHDQVVEFRYFVGVVLEPGSADVDVKQIIVRRWETQVQPRTILKDAICNVNGIEDDVNVFGIINHRSCIERGWLTSETVLQLKLFNNPLQLWKKRYEGKRISLKVTPLNLARNKSSESVLPFSESIEESMDTHDQIDSSGIWPLTEVAVMNEEKRELRLQNQFGHIYNGEEFVLFQISILCLEAVTQKLW